MAIDSAHRESDRWSRVRVRRAVGCAVWRGHAGRASTKAAWSGFDGEDGEIWIGDDVVIMENAWSAVIASSALISGSVLIGPHAHLNGATVEDEVFIATGASLFPGSVAASGSEWINSVLPSKSKLAPGTTVPIGWIAAGDPAQLFPPDQHEDLWRVQVELDFPGTVYGVPRGTPMRTIMASRPSSTGLTKTTKSLIVSDVPDLQHH